jgi:hypothetical protein
MDAETKLRDATARVDSLERKLHGMELERDWWKLQYQTTILREVPTIQTALSKMCAFVAKTLGIPEPSLDTEIIWGSEPGTPAPGSPAAAALLTEKAVETDEEKAARLLIESAAAFKPALSAATVATPGTISIAPEPLPDLTPAPPMFPATVAGAPSTPEFDAFPSPAVVPMPPAAEASPEPGGIDTTDRLRAALASGVEGGEAAGQPAHDDAPVVSFPHSTPITSPRETSVEEVKEPEKKEEAESEVEAKKKEEKKEEKKEKKKEKKEKKAEKKNKKDKKKETDARSPVQEDDDLYGIADEFAPENEDSLFWEEPGSDDDGLGFNGDSI